MSRWIDAEWLLNFFEPYPNDYQTPLGSLRACVDDAPSIDIVRCKECVYCVDAGAQKALVCDNSYIDMDIHPDDFCSYGERRERVMSIYLGNLSIKDIEKRTGITLTKDSPSLVKDLVEDYEPYEYEIKALHKEYQEPYCDTADTPQPDCDHKCIQTEVGCEQPDCPWK